MAASAIQEKPKWQLESSVNSCGNCSQPFSSVVKKHHCRACGKIFCGDCSACQRELPQFGYVGLQTVCKSCKLSLEGDSTLIATSYTAVQLMMRDMQYFAFKAELFQMGTRGGPRKLLAEATDAAGASHVFAMTTISDEGNAIFKDESKRRIFAFILKDTITHPYICAPSFAQLRDSKSVVITPYQSAGSIRDMIYITPDLKKKKITPKSKHFEKYFAASGGKPLEVAAIAKYGRQILEALFYLYLHGFPFPHLHSGNVVITENDHAQLIDLEESLLCLDPKPIREIRRMLTTNPEMAPEVISFGLVLYEMAMGHEKGDRPLKDAKAKCPAQLFPILESILEPATPDNSATLKSLLRLPFFQEVTLDVTVHQVVLSEKWDDRVRAILKLVRAATTTIVAPPTQPLLKSSSIKLSAGSAASATVSSASRPKSGSSSSASSSATSAAPSSGHKRQTSRTAASSSSSPRSTSPSVAASSIPKPPTPPPAGAPAPPPPPPPSMAKMPAPQAGRDNLMAAIRAAGGLKSVKPSQ